MQLQETNYKKSFIKSECPQAEQVLSEGVRQIMFVAKTTARIANQPQPAKPQQSLRAG